MRIGKLVQGTQQLQRKMDAPRIEIKQGHDYTTRHSLSGLGEARVCTVVYQRVRSRSVSVTSNSIQRYRSAQLRLSGIL